MSIPVGRLAPPIAGTAYVPGSPDPLELLPQCLAGSWLALVFYAGDFAVAPPLVLRGYATLEAALVDAGARVVAASTDSFWSHKAWFESNPLLADVRYPVLADTTRRVSASFGVLSSDGTAEPAAFLLDRDGVVRHASADGSAQDAEQTLDVLRRLRGEGSQP
jgi:peroxiredoxin (alkyl hydroperoxide reductase subunit C)